MLFDPERLPTERLHDLQRPDTQLLVSSASIYELLYKFWLGKLPSIESLVRDYASQLRMFEIDELPLTAAHAVVAAGLPRRHKDPFDRLIAGQAIAEDLPIVSSDLGFEALGARRVW